MVVHRICKQMSVPCSASSDQHMKKLMSLREGPHVMMQCCMRQLFADRHWLHDHPGGHAPWREPTMRKFTQESNTYCVRRPVRRWNIQKMPSAPGEYVRKTKGVLHEHLENQTRFGELL